MAVFCFGCLMARLCCVCLRENSCRWERRHFGAVKKTGFVSLPLSEAPGMSWPLSWKQGEERLWDSWKHHSVICEEPFSEKQKVFVIRRWCCKLWHDHFLYKLVFFPIWGQWWENPSRQTRRHIGRMSCPQNSFKAKNTIRDENIKSVLILLNGRKQRAEQLYNCHCLWKGNQCYNLGH